MSNVKMSAYTKGILITIIGGACWGISGTCSQYLCSVQGMDARWITELRLLVSGILLMAAAFTRQRAQFIRLVRTPKALIHCILFGVCGLMFTQYSYITSITKTNSGTATVLQYLSVIIVLLYTCIRTKTLPVKKEVLAIISCLLGTFLVATHGSFTSLYISGEGLLWGVISAVAASIYILLPQKLMKTWGAVLPVGIGMFTGGIAFFFIMRIWTLSISFNAKTAAFTALIVFVGTLLAFTLFLKGTAIIGPARGNMLGCVEPLVATVTTAVTMGTVFAPMDIIGFIFILATVFILARK